MSYYPTEEAKTEAATNVKQLLAELIENSQYKDKLYTPETIDTRTCKFDSGPYVEVGGLTEPKIHRKATKMVGAGLQKVMPELHSLAHFDHIRAYFREDVPAIAVDEKIQEVFDEAVKNAEIKFNFEKYQYERRNIGELFQSLIDSAPVALNDEAHASGYVKHDTGSLKISIEHQNGKNRNEDQKLATQDAKKLANALKEMFPGAGITDIHQEKRHLTISADIMEQLEEKAEAGTLADEFSAAMAQVQANAQRGGGRG